GGHASEGVRPPRGRPARHSDHRRRAGHDGDSGASHRGWEAGREVVGQRPARLPPAAGGHATARAVASVGGAGAAIRGELPILEPTACLHSCSQGALSRRVRSAYEEYLDSWDERGAEWAHWVERAEAARAAFARLLRADADEVAVTTSVSQGVSGIVSALPFERGGRTRIVISEYEFPTVGQIAHAQ